jgi:hypothetical protein
LVLWLSLLDLLVVVLLLLHMLELEVVWLLPATIPFIKKLVTRESPLSINLHKPLLY